MSRENLPSGRQFVRNVVGAATLFAVPAIVVVFAFLAVLVGMSREMWWTLIWGNVIYIVLASPINHLVYVRMMRPITEWLDAPAPDPTQSARAFAAIMTFPQRMALAAAGGWVVPTTLFSVSLWLRHPDTWGVWESFVLMVAGASAGGCSAILAAFRTRAGSFADVREAAAMAVGGPEQRRRLAPQVSVRQKTLASVGVATVVPLVLATLIAMRQGEVSIERFTEEWTRNLLVALPADGDPDALEQARAGLQSSALPVAVNFWSLEEFGPQVSEEVKAGIERALAQGQTRGDSASVPSEWLFAWRTLADDSTWVVAVHRGEVLALSGVSLTALGVLLLLLPCLFFAGLVAWLLARDITEPAAILREAADRLALGDLRPGRIYESADELGELSRSFEVMSICLRTTIGALAESADDLEHQAGSLAPVCRRLGMATGEQVEGTRRAAEAMEEIRGQVAGIAESSQGLNSSIEESSSSVLELGATGQELNETASLLTQKVEEVSSSIEQMMSSVKQVSRSAEALADAADQNSASMEEMASSLRQVDSSAEEAAQLSRTVVERAEIGRDKVRETIVGMEAIREATDTAEEVIRHLHGRAGEIGAIVDVIDDVADETNLLALNAAIIAAQSGEHGRAFSVVADEIKDLAERVLASTKEIGGLIQSVQEESSRATGAIERGSASVASGVDLSAEAGLALEEITEASRQSGDRIGAIVSALREQAKAAGHVVELMESVRDGVEEIRRAAIEQDRGNEVVYQSSITMREVAQQVRGATEEQARGTSRIQVSVEHVREAVEQINRALQEQTGACGSAAAFLDEVRSQSATHEEVSAAMEGVVRDLLARAETLRAEVRRFVM